MKAKKRRKKICRNPGLNQGPLDLQSNALPTELFRLDTLMKLFCRFIKPNVALTVKNATKYNHVTYATQGFFKADTE